MTIFLVFPFTRLVHVWSAPVWYLGRRGYQVVRSDGRRRALHGARPSTRRSKRDELLGPCAIPGRKPTSRSASTGWRSRATRSQREMQHHPAQKPIAAWQQAARALVIRELLLQRARQLGIEPEPLSDADGRRETDDEALMRALVEREVTVPEPDEETCRRYYEQNSARFRSPDIYEASHILFAALPKIERGLRAGARGRRGRARRPFRRARSRFAALAQAYSRLPIRRQQGGNLGQITEGQTTPEFERALIALAPGELCAEPVATRYGFHIIRLERKHEGRAAALRSRSPNALPTICAKACGDAPTAQYVARLVSAAKIEGIELAGAMRYACTEGGAMMLGDVLAGLNDEARRPRPILGLGDLRLLAAIRQRAESEGVDLATYARAAVQRYAHGGLRRRMDHADGLDRPCRRSRNSLSQARLRKRHACLKPAARPIRRTVQPYVTKAV